MVLLYNKPKDTCSIYKSDDIVEGNINFENE